MSNVRRTAMVGALALAAATMSDGAIRTVPDRQAPRGKKRDPHKKRKRKLAHASKRRNRR